MRELIEELNAATEGMTTIALIPGTGMDPAFVTRHPAVKIVVP